MALCDDYSIEELIAMTDKLVKKLCCYGGGNFCDCKYLASGEAPKHGWGEQTGCCEARTLRWQLQHQLTKKKEQQLRPAAVDYRAKDKDGNYLL